jgi:hypothetical protein
VRRICLTALVVLAFASPAYGADIYVNNKSSLPQEQVADAMPVFQQALDQDFAPVWREALGSRLVLGAAPEAAGAWEIRLVDDMPECWICAGYHGVDANQTPFAAISTMDDWQLTFTHELWELVVNPYAKRTATVKWKKKSRRYALETSDPVESQEFSYVRLSALGVPVHISDFVTPAWFRRKSVGPWDFTGGTSKPLQLLEGGYQLFLRNGGWDAIWASREAKLDARAKADRWTASHSRPAGSVRPSAG